MQVVCCLKSTKRSNAIRFKHVTYAHNLVWQEHTTVNVIKCCTSHVAMPYLLTEFAHLLHDSA